MMDLRAAQLEREESADAAAVAARLLAIDEMARTNVAATPRGSAFMGRAVAAVAEHIREVCEHKPGARRPATGLAALRKIDPEVAAAIAVRECINRCSELADDSWGITLQELAIAIGELYDTEIMIADAAAVNPMYMQKVAQRIEEAGTSSLRHIRKAYAAAYTAVMKGVIDSRLSRMEMLLLGRYGLQACVDCGIVDHSATTTRRGKANTYKLSPEVEEFLSGTTANDLLRVTDSAFGSMICPPDPWTNMYDGGYVSSRRKAAHKLISIHGRTRNQIKDWMRKNFTSENSTKEFAAVNYLQGIAYSVHAPTVARIREVWEAGGGILGVPEKNTPKKPPCPLPEHWEVADGTPEELRKFNDWKGVARRHYESLRRWRSKTREIGGLLKALERDDGRIWFPVFMDTRGRKYYRGYPSPQGTDIAKSCLHFSDKKPLGSTGVFWLKVHIANCLGFDKGQFTERAAYVDQHWDRLMQALQYPATYYEVLGKDSPWGAWAALYELDAALKSGNPEEYLCGIPVHMDATCSGMQHFSALLRDPVGGKYVNLCTTSSDLTKNDIYGHVSNIAMKYMQDDDSAIAGFWKERGISRALAKKPVMTYVYSAVLSSTADWIEDEVHADTGWPEWIDRGEASRYAAKLLFKGIEATVPAVCSLMRWLKEVAGDCSKKGPMLWRTPTNFPVWHDYRETDDHRVKVASCGAVYCNIREYSSTIDRIRSKNAISPNFVHSLDGSHVTATALRMQEAGMQMAAIHDSFGTHPSDVGAMHSIIRDVFVQMYSGNSVLGEFVWSVGVPCETPMKGALDLNVVRDSWAFFC